MLKHRPIQNHYDFELEAGIAKHCLGVKIVYIGMIKSKSYFQEKVPYQVARVHVHHASHHLMSLTIELLSPNFIGVQISTSLAQRISKSRDLSRARALHVYNAPQHPKSCTSE